MREIVYDNYFWQNDLVRLRPWSSDDWEWDYYNRFDTSAERLADCEVHFPATVLEAKEYSERIANLSNNNNRTYFAIETLEGTHVGRINLLSDDEKNGTFEMGILIDRDYRGKGYGTDAMKILLKYAFMERRLNKYCASIIEGNVGSAVMHRKLGCEQEGVCKQNIYTNGRYYDEILFGLTKEDYLYNVEFEQVHKKEGYKLNLRKETQHFIINYTEMDKTCIDKVSDILENNYNRITMKFKEELQEKLTVEIHSDLNELHVALGFPDAPDWIRGGIGIDKIVIASPLNPPPGSQFDNVVNTAVHEFVHIIVNKINEDTPRWLNEGIACYEAKDNNDNWIRKTIKNGLESNTLPTFKDLDTGEDFETFFKRDGYQYSYTIVESIIEEFGYDKLYNFIKSPNNFVDVFDITENQLQNKWIEDIKKNYLCNILRERC